MKIGFIERTDKGHTDRFYFLINGDTYLIIDIMKHQK
jgi:hypothetical protein